MVRGTERRVWNVKEWREREIPSASDKGVGVEEVEEEEKWLLGVRVGSE
jgi:hypothetical protein